MFEESLINLVKHAWHWWLYTLDIGHVMVLHTAFVVRRRIGIHNYRRCLFTGFPKVSRLIEFCLSGVICLWWTTLFGFQFKVKLSYLIGFKSRWRLLCVTWNLVNGIRLTFNAHISQYINGFYVIQIGDDSLYKELSSDRSYVQFR